MLVYRNLFTKIQYPWTQAFRKGSMSVRKGSTSGPKNDCPKTRVSGRSFLSKTLQSMSRNDEIQVSALDR
jgi:hypothetical protein